MSKRVAPKKKHPFPDELYITHDKGYGGDDDFFVVSTSINSGEDGELVATYALVEVATKRVTHAVEPLS